jgi:hypothetical protein
VKHRVVTTDYDDDGTPILVHHDVVDTFEEARMDAELLKDKHAIVSIYRYTGGEPDLLWSTRAE